MRLLVTGAGYLGLRLTRAWLAEGGQVVLWARARDGTDLARVAQRVGAALGPAAAGVTCVGGDLGDAQPFAGVDPATVAAIVHTAAATRFNVDAATADAINIEGTRKLLAFAGRCPRLGGVTLVSSVYASGLREGVIAEEPCADGAGFANHYERSKWAAERVLLGEFGALPWRVARVATVIADDDSGRVTQQNAFHNTLKLLFYGLLSVIPGQPETPLYFVTGEFVTRALVELLRRGPLGAVVHVCHTRAESATVGALVDVAFAAFEQEPDFKKRRVLKPLYSDAEAFDLLADGVRSFAGGVVTQAVSSVAPFARQLFVSKDVRNDRLRAVLAAYRAPDPRALIARTCAHLASTRWGRETGEASGA